MSSSDIQQIKERLNISDIVRRYVELKHVSGRWMGACPFHQETKPSMSVNDDEGYFYCFGCQASGDVIAFYQRINGLEFPETLEQLAKEAGVELSKNFQASGPKDDSKRKLRQLCLDLHETSQKFFKSCLKRPVGKIASNYIQQRGIAPEIVERFGLGCSPDDWHGLDNYLKSKGFSSEDGATAGLLSKNDKGKIYDRFRGRLIFPIQNLSGKVIAFGGRVITDGEPKYLNSSDTPIYKKGDNLYGLYQARPSISRTKRALLTEGYMDVLSLHQFGYTDACGVLGTALTPDQVKRLSGFCSGIDLLFDGDAPGRKAAFKSSEMILQSGVKCRVILLPEGEDVDSILQSGGTDALDACFDEAVDGFDFCMTTLLNEYAPKEIMNWAGQFLRKMTDSSLRSFYLPRLAEGLYISENDLRQGNEKNLSAPTAQQYYSEQEGQPQQFNQNGPSDTGSDLRTDLSYIRFGIKYPQFIQDLDDAGLAAVLTSATGQRFWSKIVTFSEGDILPWLDESEKLMWIQTREELTTQKEQDEVLQDDQLENEALFHLGHIFCSRAKIFCQQLKEALDRATKAHDMEHVQKYLTQLHSVSQKKESLDRALKADDLNEAREYMNALNDAFREE
ncbi:MAG: DNA primase [Desulfovibrio sp.]